MIFILIISSLLFSLSLSVDDSCNHYSFYAADVCSSSVEASSTGSSTGYYCSSGNGTDSDSMLILSSFDEADCEGDSYYDIYYDCDDDADCYCDSSSTCSTYKIESGYCADATSYVYTVYTQIAVDVCYYVGFDIYSKYECSGNSVSIGFYEDDDCSTEYDTSLFTTTTTTGITDTSIICDDSSCSGCDYTTYYQTTCGGGSGSGAVQLQISIFVIALLSILSILL